MCNNVIALPGKKLLAMHLKKHPRQKDELIFVEFEYRGAEEMCENFARQLAIRGELGRLKACLARAWAGYKAPFWDLPFENKRLLGFIDGLIAPLDLDPADKKALIEQVAPAHLGRLYFQKSAG